MYDAQSLKHEQIASTQITVVSDGGTPADSDGGGMIPGGFEASSKVLHRDIGELSRFLFTQVMQDIGYFINTARILRQFFGDIEHIGAVEFVQLG